MKANEYQKKIVSIVRKLGMKHGERKVWSDFVTIYSCEISNSFDRRFFDDRAKMYQDRIEKYTEEEFSQLVTMGTLVIHALTSNPEQDFLGGIYKELGLCNKYRCQYFTPYPIGSAMANMETMNLNELIEKKHVISVADLCCGAGCLLIAFANEVKKQGIDFQDRVLYVAQDIDETLALMAYIQLSLLGCAAIVKIGNSLTEPFVDTDMKTDKVWLTPYYFSDIWNLHRRFAAISKILMNDTPSKNGGTARHDASPEDSQPK